MNFKKTFWQFQNKKGSTTTADHLDDYSVKRLAVIKVLGEKKFKELTDSEVKKLIQQVKILQVVGVDKTTDSGSRVFDRLFRVLDNAKQYKISCLDTGIFKPFRIVATYRTSGKKRSFLVLANSFNEAKNKVKRHYEKSGLQGILSDIEKFEGYEIKSIPTEKFKKHYGNKEVIEN